MVTGTYSAMRTTINTPRLKVRQSQCVKSLSFFWSVMLIKISFAYSKLPHFEGVSGVMIGRGALIKPWLFQEIKEQRHLDPSSKDRFEMLQKFCKFGENKFYYFNCCLYSCMLN